MGKLLMKTAGVAPPEIELREGTNRIGRDPDNDFSIQEPSVSLFHCVLTLHEGTVFAKDLCSTNGTFIDGQPFHDAILVHGQTLRLGRVELSYRVAAPSSFAARIIGAPAPGAESKPVPDPRLAAPTPATPGGAETGSGSPGTPLQLAHSTAPPPPKADGGPPVADPCRHHPQVPAGLVCKQCGALYCRQCVDEQKVGTRLWRLCPVCKGECVSLEARRAARERELARERRTFFQELPGMFKYPFGQGGLLLLILGTVAYCLLDLVKFFARYVSFLTIGTGAAFLIVLVTGYGYLFAYMQKIIVTSARGEEGLPDWPEFGEWWNDILRPFFMLGSMFTVCFGPALGYLIWSASSAAGSAEDVNVLILFPLIGLGFVYFPMALLAVAMADSFAAMNPFVVVPTILKVPRPYAVACGVFFPIVVARYACASLLAHLSPVPYVHAIPAGFLALYLLTVEMRLLGMMYYKHREQFGWYRST